MNNNYVGLAALVGASLFSGCVMRSLYRAAYVCDVNGDGRNDVVEERDGEFSVWVAQPDGSLAVDRSIEVRVDEEKGVLLRQPGGVYKSLDSFDRVR